jgi:hypothetical protein
MTGGVSASANDIQGGMLLFDSLGGLVDPTRNPEYRLSCEGAEVRMTVKAGTGFIQIQH